MYANLEYDPDDPWNELFRNQVLVWVSILIIAYLSYQFSLRGVQAYIYLTLLEKRG